jgi:hypothetical protein
MLRKLAASLVFPIAVVASTAACTAETAETSAAEPADLPAQTVDPQGLGPCTSGGVVIPCQEAVCTLPGSTVGMGRGPAFGYYSREQCDAFASSCGKTVIAFVPTRYLYSGISTTGCYFR